MRTGKAAGWGGQATRGHGGDVLSGPQGSPKLAVPPQAGGVHPTAHPRTGQTVRSALQVTFQTGSISSKPQAGLAPADFPGDGGEDNPSTAPGPGSRRFAALGFPR